MKKRVTEKCSLEMEGSKKHPLMQGGHGQAATGLGLRQLLINRFLGRSGGFLSTRHEIDLMEAGIMTATSVKPRVLAGEYTARYLAKAVTLVNKQLREQGILSLNLVTDASRVAKHEAR